MTEAEMDEFLRQNRDAFLEASRKAVFEKIGESMKWSLPDVIHTTVNEFLLKEIAPEVGKMLTEQKGVILAAAQKSAVALSNTLAEKMMEGVTKGLDSYRAEKVFKALLGIDSRY